MQQYHDSIFLCSCITFLFSFFVIKFFLFYKRAFYNLEIVSIIKTDKTSILFMTSFFFVKILSHLLELTSLTDAMQKEKTYITK